MNDPLDRFLREQCIPVPQAPLGHEKAFERVLSRYRERHRLTRAIHITLAALLLVTVSLPLKDEAETKTATEEAIIVETLDDFNQLISSEEAIYLPY